MRELLIIRFFCENREIKKKRDDNNDDDDLKLMIDWNRQIWRLKIRIRMCVFCGLTFFAIWQFILFISFILLLFAGVSNQCQSKWVMVWTCERKRSNKYPQVNANHMMWYCGLSFGLPSISSYQTCRHLLAERRREKRREGEKRKRKRGRGRERMNLHIPEGDERWIEEGKRH